MKKNAFHFLVLLLCCHPTIASSADISGCVTQGDTRYCKPGKNFAVSGQEV